MIVGQWYGAVYKFFGRHLPKKLDQNWGDKSMHGILWILNLLVSLARGKGGRGKKKVLTPMMRRKGLCFSIKPCAYTLNNIFY